MSPGIRLAPGRDRRRGIRNGGQMDHKILDSTTTDMATLAEDWILREVPKLSMTVLEVHRQAQELAHQRHLDLARTGFRDGPIPPRDLDMGRGRRDSRDGSINAGPGYSDAPPFGQPSFGRGAFNGRGRGRGRGDFGFRDRRGPADDRNTFRPRDRSPPTRWGSVSRNDRDDWRPERREDDRWLDRDDREREPDRFRRDPATSRFDSRPPTPHQ
ncbi:hypothetical protein KCU68_g20056, partial [Aureobasidium melanogenum]